MNQMELSKAKDLFLNDQRIEKAHGTYRKYKSVLNVFEEWYETAEVESLADLNGGDLHEFKRYCREDRDNKEISLNGTMAFLRVFIKFCEEIEVVEEGLADKVPVPSVDEEDEVNHEMPKDEHMEQTLEYYRTYEEGSRTHVELELAAEHTLRLGAMRAPDEDDHDYEEQTIQLRHRPEGESEPGTTLKNKGGSERIINISDRANEAIQKYKEKRKSVIDRYGRNPLLATPNGRPIESTIRNDFYKATRPCMTNQGCPHDRNPDECEATKAKQASECPSSFSPHPIRQWGIVDHLDQGVPIEKVSERADVSIPVLKQHYDPKQEERSRKEREKTLNEHHDAFGPENESAETPTPDSQLTDPNRPIDVVAESLKKRLDYPVVVDWFIDDLRAGSTGSPLSARTRVMKTVAAYCMTTAIVEISALLAGLGSPAA